VGDAQGIGGDDDFRLGLATIIYGSGWGSQNIVISEVTFIYGEASRSKFQLGASSSDDGHARDVNAPTRM